MSQTSIYNRYSPNCVPGKADHQPVWCFVFNAEKLLIKVENDDIKVPVKMTMQQIKALEGTKFYLGQLDGCDCYCIETDNDVTSPQDMIYRNFFSLFGQIDDEIFMLAGRACHILNWHRKNQYCGSCGAKTVIKQDELAKLCPACRNIIYPKISPAIITAVLKGDKILLAQARNFRKKFYSLIAGFVEPGETLEDCVKREVYEEVGVRVRNIQYFGSQPWPFPDSLMIGFIAEYESGEISVDDNELDCADWFKRGNLPDTPTESSIAGQIIKWFCNK